MDGVLASVEDGGTEASLPLDDDGMACTVYESHAAVNDQRPSVGRGERRSNARHGGRDGTRADLVVGAV
jgi:hypothetical protein